MDIEISSFTPNGHIDISTSINYAHKYLISAFIANKGALIKNINMCEDIIYTLNALKEIGANFTINKNDVEFSLRNKCPNKVTINVGNSTSTLRFLLPLVTYLCENTTFKGTKQLFHHTLKPYLDLLDKQNINYQLKNDSLQIFNKIKPTDFFVDENISSQFISGWLFLLAFSNETHFIKINSHFESKNNVEITLDVLQKIGVKFIKNDLLIINSFSNFNYLNTSIEKDFSQLALFSVLGSIKGSTSFSNLNLSSLQNNKQIIDILMDSGAKIDFFGDNITFFHSMIKGTTIDISNLVDLAPILFVLGATSFGTTKLINTKNLSLEESNRLLLMKEELSKANVNIEILDNEIIINGNASYQGNYTFSSHNDQYICMALSIFSIINEGKSLILDCDCVNKSYPNFFKDLFSLRKEVL